eukprot:m.134463 g.134463  ORF g.134463 m.134463 type:complete len:194 (+) comp22532_c0_seq1:191-772(+)
MSFIFDLFRGLMKQFGFIDKSGVIVFLGLDAAGKTSLLHMLKHDRVTQPEPTLHPTSEELSIGGITFTTYDLGGHFQARKVWPNYFPVLDGIVFIVDAHDKWRLEDAKAELDELLADDDIAQCPILVLGNKIDMHGAVSEEELTSALGLGGQLTGKSGGTKSELQGRPLELFMCSVKRRAGYGSGFRWLSNYM